MSGPNVACPAWRITFAVEWMKQRRVTLSDLDAEDALPEGAPRPLYEAAMKELRPASELLELMEEMGKITSAEAQAWWQWMVALHYGVAQWPDNATDPFDD